VETGIVSIERLNGFQWLREGVRVCRYLCRVLYGLADSGDRARPGHARPGEHCDPKEPHSRTAASEVCVEGQLGVGDGVSRIEVFARW
jgi:hypothetical protein